MHTALIDNRTLAAQPTAVRRTVLRPGEAAVWISMTLREIAEALRCRRIVPSGFPFSRRHPAPDGMVVVEAGFPLALPVVTDGATQACELPAGPVAVTTHHGPYDKIDATHDLIADWLREHGARPAGDPWEIYHSPPIGSPDDWHTEIVQPFQPIG
ncbi:GyrI-like small molecule binding protein [Kribbella voronezhensis]|uniref:GyrI-like small molecule binding protein n=1 Tax=Kribbella voronezhensis TaxID=2512212 RepID=A0A4V3FIU3_9ACTN|nr:GyrI-like domain-containing protein [Kribbella voronezhensis]TDU83793.1 GyrI-like small molecule binding protein [Kribbella voronezhensis]